MTRNRSPFPGWDPYLQRYWRDVHQSLIVYTRDALRVQLPDDLRTRIEERVVLEAGEWEPTKQAYVPDVYVVERPGSGGGSSARASAVAEPVKIHFHTEPMTEGYIEIREASSGGRVITIIEFLSLTNKTPGPGRTAYLEKQQNCVKGNVSFVEIDLIRGGEHTLSLAESSIPIRLRMPPRVCIALAWDQIDARYYPILISQRLPAIEIPLRQTDKPAVLDLQAVYDMAYANGDYGADIDYGAAPPVWLTPQEEKWADEHLRAQQVR